MLSNEGMEFLLSGRATPNQLMEFRVHHLRELLSVNGLIAFNEKLISFEQFKEMEIGD